MSRRISEVVAIRAGSVIKSGRAWHRQVKLQRSLTKGTRK